MKSFCIVALALVACAAAETYTTENDNLDIVAVVENLEKLKLFVGCFNNKNECDEVSSDFKKDLPEAVLQACAKCTEAQKNITKVFLKGLKEKLPAEYTEFRNKYDPTGKYFQEFEDNVAKV